MTNKGYLIKDRGDVIIQHTLGGITRAMRNLRQLFLHPRAANGEADKVVATDFLLTPLPSSSRASRGAKR